MTVHPTPANLIKGVARRAVPKPRESKPKPRYTGATPAVLMLVKARANGRCERCAAWIATDAEVHHRIPRGMGGSRDPRINLPSNLLVLCPACHRSAESNRQESYENGWLVHRTAEPNATPVESKLHGYVLLGDDGSIQPIGGAA